MGISGERVKALREAKRWSQTELADAATALGHKLAQQTVADIERGKRVRTRALRELSLALETSDDYLLGLSDDPQPKVNSFIPDKPLHNPSQKSTLNVWRVSPGGAMAEWLLANDPIDAVTRPDGLEASTDAFALRIPDDTISPAYEEGDVAYVDLSIKALPGHHCIICRELPGRVKGFSFVARRLLGFTATTWKVRQYQPARDYEMSRKAWPLAIKLLGKKAR